MVFKTRHYPAEKMMRLNVKSKCKFSIFHLILLGYFVTLRSLHFSAKSLTNTTL